MGIRLARRRRSTYVWAVAALAALAGCAGPRSTRNVRPYHGPTDPADKVVAEINANARAVPTLWARHYVSGDIVDDRGKVHHFPTEGLLLMSKPASLRFVGKKPGARVFDLGTDGERFWMSIPLEIDTMWWGFNRNIGKPCARPIPVRPDAIFEVLGVGEIDPVVAATMRFVGVEDAYEFFWRRDGGKGSVEKEVWYDRVTKLPAVVRLLDPKGRLVLRADLSDHKRIDAGGGADLRRPLVARVYRLSFPESGSKITMSLEEVRLRSEEGAPNGQSFAMPDPDRAGVSKVVQIDENCE